MHILLDNRLNEVASNVRQRILEEVKDDFLNQEIRRFVRNKAFNPPSEKGDGHEIRRDYSGIQNLFRTFE